MSAGEAQSPESVAMGCWLCEHPVTGSSCAKCGCLAHYPPHQRVEVCVHCGDTVTNPPPGDWWTHARRAPDGVLHTGRSRCQSPDVPYGHLAHPADVPCRADGSNPCLGASTPPVAASASVPPEWVAAQRAAGWPDMHPEDFCHRCGVANPNWYTSRETWMAATKAWAAETGREGICCPACLITLHEQVTGERVLWELVVHPSTSPASEVRDA